MAIFPGNMATLTILTGPLGCGKTTTGSLLAQQLPRGVHIESDLFYGFFSHRIPPHLPQANEQNEAAIASAMQAAQSLCGRQYNVVLEGIFGPWFLPLIRAEIAANRLDVRYVVLRTTLEEACRRVRQRGDAALEDVAKAMHPQFADLGAWESHALDTTRLAPAEVASRLKLQLGAGRYALRSPS